MNQERTFGLLMGLVLSTLGLYPLLTAGSARWIALGPAVVFLLAAVIAPRSLVTLRRAWMALGEILERLTSPISLRVLYYGLILPFSFIARRRPSVPGASRWVTPPPSSSESSLLRPF